MMKVEKQSKVPQKLMLYLTKILPMLIALLYLLNTTFSFMYIDIPAISYIYHFLLIAFIYSVSYALKMCKADFYGDSIPNDDYMTRWIKNVLDDPDAVEGLVFNRWVADMKWLGIPIDWEEMI